MMPNANDTIVNRRYAPGAPQTVTETLVAYDPGADIKTETVTSSVAPDTVRRRRHGVLLSAETGGGTVFNAHDAFGRVTATSRSLGGAASLPLQSFDYAPCGDLTATHTFTNGTETITETYAYDMLGSRIGFGDAAAKHVARTSGEVSWMDDSVFFAFIPSDNRL